jgi:hypothetical protein
MNFISRDGESRCETAYLPLGSAKPENRREAPTRGTDDRRRPTQRNLQRTSRRCTLDKRNADLRWPGGKYAPETESPFALGVRACSVNARQAGGGRGRERQTPNESKPESQFMYFPFDCFSPRPPTGTWLLAFHCHA